MTASRRTPQGSHPANLGDIAALYQDYIGRIATRRRLLTKRRELTSAPSGWRDETNFRGWSVRQCQAGGGIGPNLKGLKERGDLLFPELVAQNRPEAERLLAELVKLGVNCTPWQPLLAASQPTPPTKASAIQMLLPGWGNGWAPPLPRRPRPKLGRFLPLGAPVPKGEEGWYHTNLGWE